MSGIDSEQDKQPISSVNGEASDANIQCSGKDVIGDQTTPAEGIKEAAEIDSAPASCQSESEETKKDDEDKSKDSNSAEMTVNGVGQPVDDQEKSEPSENLGERSGEEGKPSESHGEPTGEEQVNGEDTEAEAGKEGESLAESKEAEPSTETVAIETNGEQGKSSGENQECEQSVEAVAMDTTSKEDDALAESKESDPGHKSVDAAINREEVETSGDSKESEPVGAQANGEQAERKDSEASPEPVAMEKVNVETIPSEMASAHTEAEEGTKAEVPEVTLGDQPEHQPSEESNITETDTDAVEKKRAVTIDSPGNVKEPDATDVTTKQERSKTVGDIEDNANRSTIEVEDAMSKPDSEAAAPDETVSYQTSIVGGVVHKVPINSYSPKGQRKPREGSPQTQPKKKSVIEALFGRRKKSKGGPESPPGASPKGKGEKKEDQQELPEADTSGKDAEKEKLPEQPESGSVIPGAIVDTSAKGTTEPAESGAGAEGESTCDTDNKQETEGKEPAAVTEGNGEVEVKPAVAEQSEEGVKDKTLQDVEEPKQAEIEPQDGKEDSAAVESMPQEKEKESAGEPKDEQPKEDDKQAQTDSPEGETSSQPTPKKKKSTGIFGGFFARRKSRKSKDAAASPPEEKADDKVEDTQDASVSTQPTGEVAGTDQGVAPAADDANEGQQDPANPQKEATEGAIIPAVDQTVESAKEEISDSDKVDAVTSREEANAAVSEKPEVPAVKSAIPEDVQASSEEPLQSEETADAAEKSAEKTVDPVPAEDSQPEAQQEEEHLIQPKIEVNNMATEEGEAAEDTTTPQVEEPKKEDDAVKETVEKPSPESEETQDEATELKERIALRNGGSHSPTRRMQMRISYAETDGEGGREVEVIGTPEKAPEVTNQKGKADHKVSCRALGEADNEGWLSKKGGMLFLSGWKRKWVVLKDGKLYYFRTAFDLEAGGVINMQGITVAEAPEIKKKFCFKCEQPGAKPQVSVFMADSKEDMDKWLTVLAAASRGEVIQKPKQHQLAVMGEVTMRKKSGSTSAQRHSSILALGGRHDFLEDEEDRKATRRRSTPGSFSKVPKETEEEGKKAAVPSGTNQAPIDEKPADEPPAPNDQQQVASDAPSEPCGEQPALSAPSNEHLAPSDTPKEPASPDEAPEENTESGESKTTEKTVTVVVGEVFVGREKVVVESTSSTVEVSTSETTTTTDVEVTGETEKRDSATDSESPADKIDGAVIATTTESSVTVVETVKTSVEISETVETSTVVSEVQTEVQETAEADQKPEDKEGVSEASAPLESEASETTPPKDSSSPPESPSKTKWYFSLDRKQTWSVAPEPEDEKASKRSKPRLSKSSDRASIKSTSSDNESVKSPLPDDDELMRLCRSIRKARLSIVGEPVPDGAERLRALSNVQGNDVAIMRLKTLERTLKDKEQHLSDLEELLNQPEINRQSIHEWKLRNSDLLEELFPKEDGEGQNEDENAAEGGESETQKQDNLEEDGAEKEGTEESSEDVEEKLDEAKEEPSGSKEEGDGNVDEKQSAPEEEVTGKDEQKLAKDEQQSTEKEKEKEKENENVLTEEGAVEQGDTPAESAPPTETETEATDGKPEHEKDISPETSSAQTSSEERKEQQESGDALNTQF